MIFWLFGRRKREGSKTDSKQIFDEREEQIIQRRKYYRLQRDVRVISDDIPGYVTVSRDISEGGIKIEVPQNMPKGQVIKITLDFETGRQIKVNAQVMWTRKNPSTGNWEVGLQFIFKSPQEKEEIRKYIEYILETQGNWYKMSD